MMTRHKTRHKTHRTIHRTGDPGPMSHAHLDSRTPCGHKGAHDRA